MITKCYVDWIAANPWPIGYVCPVCGLGVFILHSSWLRNMDEWERHIGCANRCFNIALQMSGNKINDSSLARTVRIIRVTQ